MVSYQWLVIIISWGVKKGLRLKNFGGQKKEGGKRKSLNMS